MYRRLIAMVAATAAVLAAACKPPAPSCSSETRPGILLLVLDADTRMAPTSARTALATVTEGTYKDTLLFLGWENDDTTRSAIYVHAAERVGTYDVDLSADGYVPYRKTGVHVVEGECHVERTILEVLLQPKNRTLP